MPMTPDKYWQFGSDPNFQAAGSVTSNGGMGWIGLHGEYVETIDAMTVMQSQCDVCSPPATGFFPPGNGQPPVPLKYMTPDDMRWAIANNEVPASGVFGGVTAVGTSAGAGIASSLVPPGYIWFGGAFKPQPGVGQPPGVQFIWNDLLAEGLAPQDIQLYGLEADQYLQNEIAGDPALVGVNYDWAAKYAAVLQFVNNDHPDIMQHLAQKLTPDVIASSNASANALLTQAQQAAAGSKFDRFMANFGPFLLIVPYAIAIAPAVLAAGAANAATAGTATTAAATTAEAGTVATTATGTGIDAATAQAIGTGWESAAATSSLQNAALAAAGGDATAAASLTAAVGADQAAAMIASAQSLLSGAATAGAATATATEAAAPATGAASSGESAASLLSAGKTAAGIVSTAESALSYGQRLLQAITGQHPAAPSGAPVPAQAGLALPSGIAKNFPVLLGGALLLAVVVKRKGKARAK